MKHCIAIGFSEGSDQSQIDRVQSHAHQIISAFTGSAATVRISDRLMLVLTDVDTPAFYQQTQASAVFFPVRATYTVNGTVLQSAQDIFDFQRTRGVNAYSDVMPPFAAMVADPEAIRCFTDACGLQHIYYTLTDDFAAVSTSSSALAKLVNASFDFESLAVFSQLGHLLGDQSLFESIQKIPQSSYCEIRNGTATIRAYVSAPYAAISGTFQNDEQAVSEGVEVVRECVQTALKAFPDAKLEVSGGFDSRLILAAIPREQRRKMHGVTIGSPMDPDYLVARRIAQDSSFRHDLIRLDVLAGLSHDEIFDLLKSSAKWCDYSSMLLPRATIEYASREIGYGPRMGGANGEFARGFYYPAQPDTEISRTLVERLINWRICVAPCVAPDIFRPEYRALLKDVTRRHIHEAFSGYSGGWLRSTDEYYLDHRMQRWAGSSISSMSSRRAILLPYFDPRFIKWARQMSPRMKRSSSIFAMVLEKLDPGLFAIPLDTGKTPQVINDSSFSAKVSRLNTLTRKTVAKVMQKLKAQNQSNRVENVLREHLQEYSTPTKMLPRVMDLDFIDSAEVTLFLGKRSNQLPSTLGFLLSLEWSLQSVPD